MSESTTDSPRAVVEQTLALLPGVTWTIVTPMAFSFSVPFRLVEFSAEDVIFEVVVHEGEWYVAGFVVGKLWPKTTTWRTGEINAQELIEAIRFIVRDLYSRATRRIDGWALTEQLRLFLEKCDV